MATVTTPGGAVDPTPSDDSATDTTQIVRRADLNTTKDDFSSTAVAGQSTTYTVVVTNQGPSNVFAVPVTDSLPIGATSMNWTCVASAGATCDLSGSGAVVRHVRARAPSCAPLP